MFRTIAAGFLALALASCTTAQTTTATTDINSALNLVAGACAAAETALGQAQGLAKGGAASTVSNLGTYVAAGCATAAGAQKLAADPTSTQWLGQIIGALNTLSGKPAA